MDIIYTARIGINADIFPNILKLYVQEGSTIADVTYGKGVFWRNVDLTKYKLLATDLKNGIDMRSLPYDSKSIDSVVIDPPYMPTQYTGVSEFSEYYGIERKFTDKKWHNGVIQLYEEGIVEAERVLKENGVLIVKCQDMVCANKQILIHSDLIQFCKKWFRCEDIFILVQGNRRPHPRKNQVHARKNHSYFLIFLRNESKWEGIKYINE